MKEVSFPIISLVLLLSGVNNTLDDNNLLMNSTCNALFPIVPGPLMSSISLRFFRQHVSGFAFKKIENIFISH